MTESVNGASSIVSNDSRLPEPDTDNMRSFDVTSMKRADQFKLFVNTVVPRPIALVTTTGPAGRNAAPFSFFNVVGIDPPTVMFSVGPTMFDRRSEEKDTLVNIRANGEFVVHLVDEANKDKMNACQPEHALSVDEAEFAGFQTAPSMIVAPPRLVECPVQLECKVTSITEIGKVPYQMVLGEVVFAHYRDGILNDELHVDPKAINAIGRLVNPGIYCRTDDTFEMLAPLQPSAAPSAM
jgi:flavin reductase (DIM6/NTAB) family NADH-FMN oxidoreductase RutF